MSSANTDNVSSSFLVLIIFIYFSCLIALARTLSTMLNWSSESRHSNLTFFQTLTIE